MRKTKNLFYTIGIILIVFLKTLAIQGQDFEGLKSDLKERMNSINKSDFETANPPGSYKYGNINQAIKDGVPMNELKLETTSNGLYWVRKQPVNTKTEQSRNTSTPESYNNYTLSTNNSGELEAQKKEKEGKKRREQIAAKKKAKEEAERKQAEKDKQFQQNKPTINAGFKTLNTSNNTSRQIGARPPADKQQSQFKVLGQSNKSQDNQNQVIAQRPPRPTSDKRQSQSKVLGQNDKPQSSQNQMIAQRPPRPLPDKQKLSSADEEKNKKIKVVKTALNLSTKTPRGEGLNAMGLMIEKAIAYVNPEFSVRNELVIKQGIDDTKELLNDFANKSEFIQKNIEGRPAFLKESVGQQLKDAIGRYTGKIAEGMGHAPSFIGDFKTAIENVFVVENVLNKVNQNFFSVFKDEVNTLTKKNLPSKNDYSSRNTYEASRKSQNEANKGIKKIIMKSN